MVQLHGKVFPLRINRYLDSVIEGIGTNMPVVQSAENNTIGIDGVAVAVNDVISARKCS